jgi:hypothetical protein
VETVEMTYDRIDFGIEIDKDDRKLIIVSNYCPDGNTHLSKNGLSPDSDVFYAEVILPHNKGYAYLGINLEEAEEIVSELSKAIKFLKE